jgi:hypothetical protein
MLDSPEGALYKANVPTDDRGQKTEKLDLYPNHNADHLVVARPTDYMSEIVRVKADLGFSWDQQDNLETRIGLIKDHLGKAFGREVAVQIIRHTGSETAPLVLTLNPLEALAFAGRQVNAPDYSAVAYSHLGAHPDLNQSEMVNFMLEHGYFYLSESAAGLWGRLPLQPSGRDTVTLWELPVNPATLILGENSDDKLWNIAPKHAASLIAAENRLPGELISWAVLLAGEPHLKAQFRSGTKLDVYLPGTKVIEEETEGNGDVPFCFEDEGGLCLDIISEHSAIPECGFCTFRPAMI